MWQVFNKCPHKDISQNYTVSMVLFLGLFMTSRSSDCFRQ